MNSAYLANPAIFLIDTLFSLYILAVVLRFLLQWVGADFYNPISQFLVKITHPPLKIMRRGIPSIGKIDTSSIVLAFVLQIISDFSIFLLKGVMLSIPALIVISFGQLLGLIFNIFIFSIFILALLSWFNSSQYHALYALLSKLTQPILDNCRKIVPDLGGMDISPLVALIGLQLAKMMLLPPLQQLAGLIG
ncbi:MAG: YggT family protein [Methylococcaceae bacterium]|nr:YggT family protein [Methylococcaceae bacterium]